MEFGEAVEVILYAFILMSSVIYSWHRLTDRKINYKSYKLYIVLVGMMMTSILNFFIVSTGIRMIIITSVFILFYYYLFRDTIHRCIIVSIYSQFLAILSEFIYTLVLIVILKGDINKILTTSFGTFLTNVVIAVLLFILVNIKFFRTVYSKFIGITEKIGRFQLIIACFVLMLVANILLMTSYYKIGFTYYFLFNILMILICAVVIVSTFKTQNNYNRVSDQYNIAKISLKDYEVMMNKYRVANHENKNLLLTLRAMVINKEKNIPGYIDSIIENKYEDDEKLLFEMSVIPTGGLRATMYSEILKIKENKIDYNINIDRRISTIHLIELDTNTIIDICEMISVFIDNSIDATKELKKKVINIDMYIYEDKLCIRVTNNYRGTIDISKISDEGYTTKEKGHGYGLSLVKKIIKNNNFLENETQVSKNTFSQILKIAYKKKNH